MIYYAKTLNLQKRKWDKVVFTHTHIKCIILSTSDFLSSFHCGTHTMRLAVSGTLHAWLIHKQRKTIKTTSKGAFCCVSQQQQHGEQQMQREQKQKNHKNQKQNTFGSSFWLGFATKNFIVCSFFPHRDLRFICTTTIKRPPAFFVCLQFCWMKIEFEAHKL